MMPTRQQNILAAAERRRQNAIRSGNTTQKNLEDTNVQNLRKKTVKTTPVKSTGPIPLVKPRTLGQIASNSITASTKDIGRPTSSAGPTGSLITPQNYRNFGLFQNQSTGAFTNSQGVSIDPMTGKPFVKQTAEVAPTEEQNAEALIYGQQEELNTLGQKYLGQEDLFPTSLEAQVQEQAAQAQRQFEASKANLNAQAQQVTEQAAQEGAAVKNTAEAQIQGLVGGRQGPSSTGNVSAQERLKQEMTKNLATIDTSRQNSLAQIEEAQAQLDYAKKTADRGLIENAQKALDYAKLQAKQIETDYVNALTMASEEERNVQAQKNANLTTFTGLVDQGVELQPDQIISFAQSLNLPFETAYAYYTGAQAIRDDKNLSLEEKQIANAQNLQNLNDQIAGMDNAAASAIRGLQTLRASGASEEEIAAYKAAAKITDYDDPLTRAELAYNQAQAKIAQNEANGLVVNPLDLIDLAQKTYDYYQSMGYNPSVIPTGGKYGAVSYTTPDGYQGVRFNVEDGVNYDNPATKRDESQCGAFVNDITGIGMGDSFESKMALVDKSIKVPAAGMAYVVPANGPYAKNGHTGMVEYFNPQTGMVGAVSANAKGDGKIVREEIPLATILNGGGFAKAPNSEPADQPVLSTLDEKTIDNVRAEAGTFRQEQIVKDYNTILGKQLSVQSILDSGVGGPADLALVFEFMKALDPTSVVREQEYANAAKSGNIFAGAFAKYNGYLKEEGGFLPDKVKEGFKELIDVKLNASQQQYDNLYEQYSSRINNLAGGRNVAPEILTDYSSAFKSPQPQAPEEDSDTALYQSLSNYNDPDYLEAQQLWVNPGAIGGYLTQ